MYPSMLDSGLRGEQVKSEQLDLVCFGRICVDLYSEQIGAPLGEVQSFAKYVGGSAANICVGSARTWTSHGHAVAVGARKSWGGLLSRRSRARALIPV